MPSFSPFSSWIAKVSHDPDTNTLTLHYTDGGGTIYENVPPEAYDSITQSPSIGTAIHAFVRGNYPHRTFK